MQPKITAHRDDSGQWQARTVGAASTWIVKIAHPHDAVAADVVDTEVLSLDVARAAGIAAAHAHIITVDGIRAIAVARYDRVRTETGVERVHQEDLAQAIGLNTADPLRKFQRGNAMPSLAQAASVLRDGGTEPDELLRLVTLNYVLGNIDAHAKNISFLRHADGTVALAPAYDIAMHLHHDGEQHRSALDINGKIDYADLDAADLVLEAMSWGLPRARAARRVAGTVDALRTALDGVDAARYPGVPDDALALVRSRAGRAAAELAAMSAASTPPGSTTRRTPVRRGPARRHS